MFSFCICCHRKTAKGDGGDVYGIVNPAVPTGMDNPDGGAVQFRNGFAKKADERHSYPAHAVQNGAISTRVSAPGRALPQLPGDMYSAIDKSRKDSIRFVDDGANPTYESIDPDADSLADPLYSKVGDPVSTRRDRKYDYPVFPGRRNEPSTSRQNDETYQSASQIYGGSEDPYSSITSTSRVAGADFGDEDSSSAYDPGYAKVKPTQLDAKRLERLERKERELDQLYSKIRRSVREPDDDDGPEPVVDLGEAPAPVVEPLFFARPEVEVEHPDSREPSYRYITVRENAERLRERLRQQGQLDPPTREHYYSTIGNEYDTIQLDAGGSTYAAARSGIGSVFSVPGQALLSVNTAASSAPPPPTSPIPHRVDDAIQLDSGVIPAYSTVNKRRTPVDVSGQPSTSRDWNAPSRGTATSFAGLSRSFTGMTAHSPQSTVNSSSSNIPGIKEFMQKPILPYSSVESILGKKVAEEREVIVEQRMSQSMGFSPILTSTTPSNERVHRVEITRLNSVDGPRPDTIISGRRYRGNSEKCAENEGLTENTECPQSSRSGLPLAVNRAETTRLSQISQHRRQKSNDMSSGGQSSLELKEEPSGNKTELSSKKSARGRDGAGNSLLSSIYTAKDYVSTVDMSNDRPWPISRETSPSSRSDKKSG